MLRALLLLLSCLADYETVREIAQGAFTAGLVNLGALSCVGTLFAVRRGKLFRG